MHIFKSRNPLWLIGDIICAVGFWKIPLLIPALFFTYDTILQLIYTFFPELIDAWEKKKFFRLFYVVFLFASIIVIIQTLINERVI